MASYKIAVMPGDGTGPEVVREGLKVLNALQQKCGFKLETQDFDFGGDRYLATNEVLPDSAVDELRGFDAIYLGAIGHPDVAPGILEKGILLRLRFELDQYINLRPVNLYPGVWTPNQGQRAGRDQLRGRPRELRRSLYRERRRCQKGHAKRSRRAGNDLHAFRCRPLPEVCVRIHTQTQ